MMNTIKDKEEPKEGVQAAMGLAYQLLAAMLIFVGGGYYLDHRWGTSPLYVLIGVGLAFIYGGYEVWKIVRLMQQEDEKPKPPK